MVSIATTGPRLWPSCARADRPPARGPGGGSPRAALRDRGRSALPGPLPGVVLWCKPRALAGSLGLRQAIHEGSFPVSDVELHWGLVEQGPGINAQMSSLGRLPHTGAGDATRARRRAAPGAGQAAAASGRLAGRRQVRGERGRDRGEAPPGAAGPSRLELVPAPGDLGRRRASGDRSPPRADGASRASCGASCRSQAICGSPLPAGSATRRARRTRIRGCAVPWAGSCTATSTRSTAAGWRHLRPMEAAGISRREDPRPDWPGIRSCRSLLDYLLAADELHCRDKRNRLVRSGTCLLRVRSATAPADGGVVFLERGADRRAGDLTACAAEIVRS